MDARIRLFALALVLAMSGGAFAQTSIRSESIKPPAAGKPTGHLAPVSAPAEIIADLSRLPAPVARTRERILAAARSGDLHKLAALMRESAPVFSFSDDKDPVALWKESYPDSEGIEVLSILTGILEAPFVRLDEGTQQEIYVWPYFFGVPLKTLTPQQKVELFRVVTGADYKDMLGFGAYAFYRLGIAPDGTWHFFVAGD